MSNRLVMVIALSSAMVPVDAEASAPLASPGTAVARPPVTALAFSPDGNSVLVGSQAGVERRSWPGLALTANLPTRLTNILAMAFSPDGKMLAVVGGEPAVRGTIELWSWPSGELSHRFSPHQDVIHDVSWRSDSAVIVSASIDRKVGIHEVSAARSSKFLEGHSRGVLVAIPLPGRAAVLTAGIDETIRLWDVDSGQSLRTLSNHTRPVIHLALRPAAADAPPLVASVSEDRTVRLWQPTIGRLLRFVRLKSVPMMVAWTADGRMLYVACKDGRVRMIDPDTAEILDDLPGIDGVAYSLAVSADGSVLMGGQGGQLRRITWRRMSP